MKGHLIKFNSSNVKELANLNLNLNFILEFDSNKKWLQLTSMISQAKRLKNYSHYK